ncbi:MAG: deoxyribonuclease V [Verrucomicrobia bacterium]|nr:deoxyribonuclease V [Verrucomicrobiota bacterium]
MNIAHPELAPSRLEYAAAVALQERLRGLVVMTGSIRRPCLVAGVDVSYDFMPIRFSRGKKASEFLYAAVVVLELPSLRLAESASVASRAEFPYVPGLLSFREIPPLLEAFRKLRVMPDVVLVDGQGIAHPRRCGLASHLGLVLDLPAVGCAKSRLIGEYREPGLRRGSASVLCDAGEVIGRVVRTRNGVAPLFVSVGHKISLDAAVALVLKCTSRFRLPETTRQAHTLVNQLRSEGKPCA